jgi:hypothetical protein
MALDYHIAPLTRQFFGSDQNLPVLAQTGGQRALAASTLSDIITGSCEIHLLPGEDQWIARVPAAASVAERDAALAASDIKIKANQPRQFLIPEGSWRICWIAA